MAKTNRTHHYPSHLGRSLEAYASDNIIDFQGVCCPLEDYTFDRPRRPEKKSSFISVRVPDAVKEHMQAIADAQDRPLSWLVCKVLQHCHDHGIVDEIVG